MRTKTAMTAEGAEILALRALQFLASDPERLGRFLAATGTGPEDLKARAGDPTFLGSVLDHLLQDESLIFLFAETENISPAAPEAARRMLPGGLPLAEG